MAYTPWVFIDIHRYLMTVRNQILSLVDEQLVAGTFYYHYSIEMHNRGCYISHAFPNPPEHVMFILRPNVLLSVGSTKKKKKKKKK